MKGNLMKPVQLKDFLNYEYLSNLETNDIKTYFAYIKTIANEANNNYDTELYIHDGENAHRALNLKNNNRFYFETDTTLLIPFTKTDEEKEASEKMMTTLYRYDIIQKTFEKAHALYVPLSSLEVVSDSCWIINTSLREDAHTIYEDSANRDDYIDSLKTHELYEEITSIPFYRDGGDFIRDAHSQVLIYNPLTKSYKRLFDKDVMVQFSNYNKDTNKLYLLTQKHTGIQHYYQDAYIYDIDSDTLDCVYESNESISISYFFELKNSLYFLASDMKKMGLNSNNDFYFLEEGKVTKHLDFGLSSYNSTGSDSRFGFNKTYRIIDDALYFVGTYKNHSPFYKFDGDTLSTIYKEGSIDGYIPFKDNWILIGLFDNKLQELYRLDNNFTRTQISDYNKKNIEGKYIADPIYHTFKNGDVDLDGWVLLPKDYDRTKSYPGILDIHGGPKTIYNENFFHEMQVWANLGYIVFYCNPRGGDGYGDDFADIRGQYGQIDYDDLMIFTDFVLENYALDKDRMGVTGGSYGGFMTNWIVSHTHRFKVAATQRSISNWISFYGTSDIGYYFGPDQTDADPILNFEKAWEQSPLKHAHNIETPLLFIHSDKDYRCPIEQAMQLYTVVKKRGLETRFIWFKNESHGLSRDGRPKSRVKRLEEITDWMNKHLM